MRKIETLMHYELFLKTCENNKNTYKKEQGIQTKTHITQHNCFINKVV